MTTLGRRSQRGRGPPGPPGRPPGFRVRELGNGTFQTFYKVNLS